MQIHNQIQSKNVVVRRLNGICDNRSINSESVANGFDSEPAQSYGNTISQALNGNLASSGAKEARFFFFHFYKLYRKEIARAISNILLLDT